MSNYVRDTLDTLAEHVDVPDELARLYALLVFVKGDDVALDDVHDAWSLWCDIERPNHRSLVPFEQLDAETQALDETYRDAIAKTAAESERD